METDPRFTRRFRLAALLIALGLIVEAVTLSWAHPTAFLVFLLLGGLLVGAGVLLYLLAIVSPPAASPEARRDNLHF
jgi:uncharacterized membrane protein